MSLEPESINPRHAAMAEDDQHPGWNDVLPEVSAAQRVGDLLARYVDPRRQWLAAAWWDALGGKVIAHRDVLRRMFDELDANPERLRERDAVLKQQRTAETDSVTWWQEHTAHLKREYEDSAAILERVTAASHRDRFDPSARDIDREDDRRAAALHDERAREQAPKVAS